jgi:hypothetical protein
MPARVDPFAADPYLHAFFLKIVETKIICFFPFRSNGKNHPGPSLLPPLATSSTSSRIVRLRSASGSRSRFPARGCTRPANLQRLPEARSLPRCPAARPLRGGPLSKPPQSVEVRGDERSSVSDAATPIPSSIEDPYMAPDILRTARNGHHALAFLTFALWICVVSHAARFLSPSRNCGGVALLLSAARTPRSCSFKVNLRRAIFFSPFLTPAVWV